MTKMPLLWSLSLIHILNRYVRRGSKGIALLDQSCSVPRLHYVFDVSDTGVRRNSRDPEVWQLNDDLFQPVSEMLAREYGIHHERLSPVSYTHLDVYKRQRFWSGAFRRKILPRSTRWCGRPRSRRNSLLPCCEMCIRDRFKTSSVTKSVLGAH